MSEKVGELPGMGSSIAVSLISLGLVCLLAYVTLRWLSGRGFGRGRGRPIEAAVRVVARCPLEPRRSVYVIEAAGRFFLVGVGEGPMSLLAELGADALVSQVSTGEPYAMAAAGPAEGHGKGDDRSFVRVLSRVLGRGTWGKGGAS